VTFAETVLIGLCTAFTTSLLAWPGYFPLAYLQRRNEQSKFFREKLLDCYAEFFAVAVADLERARAQAAGMALGRKDQDYTELAKLDERRHSIRLDLLRLALQIRLLEQDKALADMVQELAKAQPFMAFPFTPRWDEGSYNERFDEFLSEIGGFEMQLLELIAAVVAKRPVRV
jgi:hypothetical protein